MLVCQYNSICGVVSKRGRANEDRPTQGQRRPGTNKENDIRTGAERTGNDLQQTTRNTRPRAGPAGAEGEGGTGGRGATAKPPKRCATFSARGYCTARAVVYRARAVAREEGGALAGCARAGVGHARPPTAPRAERRTHRRANGRPRKGAGAREDRAGQPSEARSRATRATGKGAPEGGRLLYPCPFPLRSRILWPAPL